jgi:hypothetical protein
MKELDQQSVLDDSSADELGAEGHVLLRPRVPFRTRRAALEQMAAVVLASPPVLRPFDELTWLAEPQGEDLWQTPDETEQLGTGDCEDLEMYAARQDLDAGAPDVQLCMSIGAHRIEHVFGLRNGAVVDHSEAAGMPPLPRAVYEQRVCVPVRREEGGRAMMMGEGEVSTSGPSDAFDDYHIHGIAHWRSKAWEKAADIAGRRFPRAVPLYQKALPGLKSTAAYFSQLHVEAWDHAGNEAKLKKITDTIWRNKRAEELARAAYRKNGGDDAQFVLDFEKHYNRPPSDRESVRAAVKALVFIATAKEHPGYRDRLPFLMKSEPTKLNLASLQIAMIAQGLVPSSAYPVPPHCAECSERRKTSMPKVVDPDDININLIYNPSNTNTVNTSTTNTTASAPGATATSATTTQAGGSDATTTLNVPPAQTSTVPTPYTVAPPSLLGLAPVAAPPVAASPEPPPPPPAYGGAFGAFGGFGSMFGFGPFGVGSLPTQGTASSMGMPGGPGTNINNSGNVNLLFLGDGGDEMLAGDDGSGGDATGGAGVSGDLNDVLGLMASGSGGSLASLGLSTSGPDEDEEFTTGGFDDEEMVTGGFEDEEFTTGGLDDEVTTGGGDDEALLDLGEEDDSNADLLSTGGADDEGLFDVGADADAESLVPVNDDEGCETGSCGAF